MKEDRMPGPLIVITGASSGIGLALAGAFAKEGNALLLIARHMEPLPDVPPDQVVYARADVADYEAIEHAIRDAEARFGKVECLVNNAGFADARDFKSVDPASYAHEIDVNLKGVLNCTKAVIGDMSARGSGTIINISSVSDRKTAPVAVTYTATKYGVRALSESWREAEGRNGVRVVNVAPGYVRTNIHKTMGISFDEYRRALGDPDFLSAAEVADVILFCWKLPQRICIRDIVVTPTHSSF
jgi:NADP-dependent 3-hydroxy acid dehydrogenase YdfG